MKRMAWISTVFLGMQFSVGVAYGQHGRSSQIEPVRTFEVRIAPLALLVRWYGVEVAYRINDHWDVGMNGIVFGETADRLVTKCYTGLSNLQDLWL